MGLPTKSYPFYQLYYFFVMSRELMIGALRQGKTGSEILSILEAITKSEDNQAEDQPTPTLEEIAF